MLGLREEWGALGAPYWSLQDSGESEGAFYGMNHVLSSWVGILHCTGLGKRKEGSTELAAEAQR